MSSQIVHASKAAITHSATTVARLRRASARPIASTVSASSLTPPTPLSKSAESFSARSAEH